MTSLQDVIYELLVFTEVRVSLRGFCGCSSACFFSSKNHFAWWAYSVLQNGISCFTSSPVKCGFNSILYAPYQPISSHPMALWKSDRNIEAANGNVWERKKQQNWCHEKWSSPASFELLYCILVIFRSLSNIADLLFIKCDVCEKRPFFSQRLH